MTLLPTLNTSDFQIPFPFKEDTKFEDFMTEYFNSLYETKSFDRFGRSGQKQDGLDIFSKEKNTIIQCKIKSISRSDASLRRELIDELDKDFKAFTKYNKKEKLGFTKFIFASSYKNDTFIHNECTKRSKKGITVEYWSWNRITGQAPPEINQKYFPFFAEETANYYSENNSISNNIDIDKTKPILEQLFQYFKIALKEVDFLPNSILANQYPFKIEDRHQSYYKNFNLTTNNNDVFNFLSSLKISNTQILHKDKAFTKGVTNFGNKTKIILKKLSSNLIYNVYSDEKNAGVDVKYFPNTKKCQCIKCKLNRLDFESGFSLLKQRTKPIKDKLKLAYMNYQYGNFIFASKLFLEIAESPDNELKVIHFISNYNLTKLKNFIRNSYWVDESTDELLLKIEKIDLDLLVNRAKKTKDKDLINWINKNTSYTEARDKIQVLTSKIIDHYYSQLDGGWSSGQEVYELINCYAEIDLFLNRNFIVYDSFTGFSELTKNFTEGLIASLAMNDLQEGKLTSFDDWIIQKLIFYGHRDSILKYFNRYNLKEIPYKSANDNDDGFIAVIINFFNQHSELNFEKYFEENNRFFWSKYNTIFENIVILASLCNISKKDVNEISALLIKFIRSDDKIYIDKLRKVNLFIKRKGEYISKKNLQGFLIASIENKRLHSEDIFEAISYVVEKHEIIIDIPNKYHEIIESMYFDKCADCNRQHSPISALYIYKIINNTAIKNKLKTKIETILNTEFKGDLFYLAAIFDVISINDQWLNKFINDSLPTPSQSSFRELFGGKKEETDHGVNQLLNLCFKLELDLSDGRYNSFKKINNYYNWLFDMDNFNYELFNPNWVAEYPTVYFYTKFRKHDIIKAKLVEYLNISNDPILSRVFVNIYYRNVKRT